MKKLDFIKTSFLIYIIKCLLGVSICYIFYKLLPEYRLYWSMISVLLVISEDDMESKKLPISRIKANVIGSLVGFVLFFMPHFTLWIICLGVMLTIFICYYFKLGAATRTALAALIIVAVDSSRRGAFERIGSVILGCIVALFITYLFQFLYPYKPTEK